MANYYMIETEAIENIKFVKQGPAIIYRSKNYVYESSNYPLMRIITGNQSITTKQS